MLPWLKKAKVDASVGWSIWFLVRVQQINFSLSHPCFFFPLSLSSPLSEISKTYPWVKSKNKRIHKIKEKGAPEEETVFSNIQIL